MSYPPESNGPDEHHYPPSTADWVTSPLAAEDALARNPLEQADTSASGRLGAVLVIVGGLLAIVGSVMQLTEMIHRAPWYLWLVLFTGCLALGAAGGSLGPLFRAAAKESGRVIAFTSAAIAVQVVEMVVTLVASGAHTAPVGGVWVSAGSVLLLLAGAVVQRRAGGPRTGVQDREVQAEVDARMAALPPPKFVHGPGMYLPDMSDPLG